MVGNYATALAHMGELFWRARPGLLADEYVSSRCRNIFINEVQPVLHEYK